MQWDALQLKLVYWAGKGLVPGASCVSQAGRKGVFFVNSVERLGNDLEYSKASSLDTDVHEKRGIATV